MMPTMVASRILQAGHHVSRFARVASVRFPCVAQTQYISRMAMSTESRLSSRSSTQITTIPMEWQRLCITGRGKLDQLTPLLSGYAQQPSLAESVTELVIDFSSLNDLWHPNYPPDYPQEESDHGGHGDLLHEHVRDLGLGDRETKTMLRSLKWKRHESEKGLLTDEPPESDPMRCSPETEFVTTAVIVLLSLCKNLSTLYIAEPYTGLSPILQDFLLKNNYGLLQSPGLQRLKRVEILPGPGWMFDHCYGQVEFLQYFQYFHRLPALRTVNIDSIQEYQAARSLFVPRTGNMKRIRIQHADISEQLLTTIIAIPKVLEEFKVSLGGKDAIEPGVAQIFPPTIGRALASHKDTLKVLDLDLDMSISEFSSEGRDEDGAKLQEESENEIIDDDELKEYGRDYYEKDQETRLIFSDQQRLSLAQRGYGWTIGSLHDFSSLTHLSIGVSALLGPSTFPPDRLARQPPFRLVDILPPGLEYFCLYDYKKGANIDVDEHINEFMANKKARYPELKEVRGVDDEVRSVAQLFPDTEEEDRERWETPELDLEWRPVEPLPQENS